MATAKSRSDTKNQKLDQSEELFECIREEVETICDETGHGEVKVKIKRYNDHKIRVVVEAGTHHQFYVIQG